MKKSLTLMALIPAFIAGLGAVFSSPSSARSCTTDLVSRDRDAVRSQDTPAPESETCTWGSPPVRLHIFRPDAEGAQAPLLYLPGGPGSHVAPQAQRFRAMASALRRPVLVPAFAEGLAALSCARDSEEDAVWGVGRTPEEAVLYTRERQQTKLDGCLQVIRDGVGRVPGTDTMAAALVQLRALLSLTAWHVMGESYGGRLAAALAERDGAGTLSLVLDSPDTPWVDGYFHTGANFRAALIQLSGLCRDHFYCPAKKLRLETDLPAAVATYRAGATVVPLKHIGTGQITAYARPTREQLLISIFGALRTPERAAILPYIAAARDREALLTRFGLLLDQLLYPAGGLNVGMFYTLRCRELPLARWYKALAEDMQQMPDLRPFLSYLAWRQRHICAGLGITPAPRYAAPDLPAVPVMLLSGGLDPVTPAPVARAGLSHVPGVHVRHYESLGHVVSAQRPCVLEDIAAFLEGRGSGPSHCSGRDLRLRFYSPVVVR
jgi:pimeloyl-ACP methyl ester carboxylesterase